MQSIDEAVVGYEDGMSWARYKEANQRADAFRAGAAWAEAKADGRLSELKCFQIACENNQGNLCQDEIVANIHGRECAHLRVTMDCEGQ